MNRIPAFVILLVDDYPDTCLALKRLGASRGYDVECCGDGDSALKIARAQKPDLIVLDAMMPDRSGLDVLWEIKADAALKDIPVVFFSATDDPFMINQAKSLGADGWILKGPHGWQNLVEQFHNLSRSIVPLPDHSTCADSAPHQFYK